MSAANMALKRRSISVLLLWSILNHLWKFYSRQVSSKWHFYSFELMSQAGYRTMLNIGALSALPPFAAKQPFAI
jgi:hypothetical protein